jgi:hypothetical protein
MTRRHLFALTIVVGGCVGDNFVGTTIDPLAPAPPAAGYQLTVGPFDVPGGTEVQICRTMKLPNTMPIRINRFQVVTKSGTHHTNLFVSDQSYPDQVFPCWNALSDDWQLLTASSQSGAFDWTLPDAAFDLKPHQQVLILSHYVNATTVQTPNGGMVWMNLYTTPDQTLASAHATTLVDIDILIPPYSPYITSKTCVLGGPVDVFGLYGHFHSRGKLFTVDHLTKDGSVLDTLYKNDNWSSPPLVLFPGPTLFGDGVHGLRIDREEQLRFTCSYDNQTANAIPYGPHADTQEHCNLVVYYSRPDNPLGGSAADPQSLCGLGGGTGW